METQNQVEFRLLTLRLTGNSILQGNSFFTTRQLDLSVNLARPVVTMQAISSQLVTGSDFTSITPFVVSLSNGVPFSSFYAWDAIIK